MTDQPREGLKDATCPVCGSEVYIHSGEEGTNCFVPKTRPTPKMELDELAVKDFLYEELPKLKYTTRIIKTPGREDSIPILWDVARRFVARFRAGLDRKTIIEIVSKRLGSIINEDIPGEKLFTDGGKFQAELIADALLGGENGTGREGIKE